MNPTPSNNPKENNQTKATTPPPPRTWSQWWKDTTHFWSHILDLREGLDRKGTVDKIKKNIETKGANVWLLICAILIASIGLDVNSPAVIIGAMLISPLMSPILGIGLSIGINDQTTLVASLKHFAIAILVSLVTSSLYFLITPLGTLTSEMAGRINPTILDVLVAIAGGTAGIVALSRKELINAIPGVAIATALLPPLCVTGFGIANWNLEITFGSFYLFFLNSTFVSLATFVVVRFLGYPMKKYMNAKERRRNSLFVAAFAFLLIIPSFVKLTQILSELREKQQLTQFIENTFNNDKHQALRWDLNKTDSTNTLKIVLVGDYIPPDSLPQYKKALEDYEVQNCQLEIVQLEEPPPDFDKKTAEIKAVLLDYIETSKQTQTKKDEEIAILQQQIINIRKDSIPFLSLQRELKILFPELERFSIAHIPQADFDQSVDSINVLMLDWDKEDLTEEVQTEKETQLKDWLQAKLDLNQLEIVHF